MMNQHEGADRYWLSVFQYGGVEESTDILMQAVSSVRMIWGINISKPRCKLGFRQLSSILFCDKI